MVAVFVLCWLPFYVLNIVNLQVVLPGDFRGLYVFVVVLSYANSCANPILYGFLSDNFKRGFRKALCGSSPRVIHHRAGSEVQRPTEEWGAIVLQLQRTEHTQKCGKDKEDKDSQAGAGAHSSDRSRSEERGNKGAAEGSRTQLEQGSRSEPQPSLHRVTNGRRGQEEPDSGRALSSTGRKIKKSKTQPEESAIKQPVLERSSL